MQVEKTHHVDADEPDADGMLGWRYEYDLYHFRDGLRTLVARSYTDEPEEAHLLRFEQDGRFLSVTARDLKDPFVLGAVRYLRVTGKHNVRYSASGGYQPVPGSP